MEVVLLGSGNVATQLSSALVNIGHKIKQVYSRNIIMAEELALKHGALAINNLALVISEADLYIIAISDNAIDDIISQVDFTKKKVVHTAGSVPLNVFPDKIGQFGVFYPFQSFSKNRSIKFTNIPICIEANTTDFEEFLLEIAEQLSENVYKLNSEQRKYLHLSGVFACNFTNHLYNIAGNILSKQNIDEKILNPLIQETANKIMDLHPLLAQTGPAVRNDTESIKKHLDLLSSSPEYQEIYKLISNDIYKLHNLVT